MAKILVLDDEAKMKKLLMEALSGEGYDIKTVSTVEQAMDIIFKEPFDLILLDVVLKDQSGMTVLKKIRKINTDVPIIIYSGFVSPELEIQARSYGANEILRKDLGITPLVDQVGKILQARDRIMQEAPTVRDKSVLVVDDEEENRNMLAIFFRDKGYNVIEAKNGEEALHQVQLESPSVVLLDMNMPVMDGLTALKKLLEVDPKLGVVMVTGAHEDEKVKKAMELGAYGYVLKPFDFTYLGIVVMSKLIIAEGEGGNHEQKNSNR